MAVHFAGLKVRFHPHPYFHPGERVLYVKGWVWFSSYKSMPSFRVNLSAPPLLDCTLYVTDRRVIHVFNMLRLVTAEFSQHYRGEGHSPTEEIIEGASTGRSRLLGPYLEIRSMCAVKRWYRSSLVRVRLFMRDAGAACAVITEAISAQCT